MTWVARSERFARKKRAEKVVSRARRAGDALFALRSSFSALLLDLPLCGKWRRGELNPRPVTPQTRPLRAYSVDYVVTAGSAEKACSGPVHHLSRPARSGRLTRDQPDLATDFWAPQAGIPQSELPISRQPEQSSFQQLLFDQFFTWPTDQPRHATSTYGHPVESGRPRSENEVLGSSIISTAGGSSIGEKPDHTVFCAWKSSDSSDARSVKAMVRRLVRHSISLGRRQS